MRLATECQHQHRSINRSNDWQWYTLALVWCWQLCDAFLRRLLLINKYEGPWGACQLESRHGAQRAFATRGFNLFYVQAGGWIRFEPDSASDETVVDARLGISYISADQACQTADTDIPNTDSYNSSLSIWDMDILITETQMEWREKLSFITLTPGDGVPEDLLINLYSAMYRTMVDPQNYTGENPLWQSDEPAYSSYYCKFIPNPTPQRQG